MFPGTTDRLLGLPVGILVATALVIVAPLSTSGYLPAAATASANNSSVSDTHLQPSHVPGRLLIKFKDNVSEKEKHDLISRNLGTVVDRVPQIGAHVIKVPDFLIDHIESRLRGDSRVMYVEKDYLLKPEAIPNDSLATDAWHLQITNTFEAYDIAKGDGITIAILDTGVQPDHPDLMDKLLPALGYNFFDNNNSWSDSCGHGTAVAGIAAASTNNSLGVVGTAWNSKILPLKVTDSSCYASSIALTKAIAYAADNGAKVANISFLIYDGSGFSDALKYMWDKGGIVVAAGGNTGALADFPDNPYLISVSATDTADSAVYYSTYGPYIDFSAPGDGSPTTFLGSKYGSMGGTSSAAPLVSGIIALMMSANPAATSQQIYDALKKGATDLGDTGYDMHYGWGRVDAYASIRYIQGSTADFTEPQTTISSAIDGLGNPITAGTTVSPPGQTTSTSVTISFRGADNVGIMGYECNLDSSSYSPCNSPVTFTGLSVNYHNFQVRAIDIAGNKDGTPASWFWQVVTASSPVNNTVDTAPPALTLPLDMVSEAAGPAGAVITYTAVAYDTIDGTVSVSCSPSSGSTFPLGSTTVNCSATDAHGNTASGSFSVLVQDTTPPALSVPTSDIVQTATSDSGATVTYSTSALDIVDGATPVSCTPSSGSKFPSGTTIVSCTSKDSHGNSANGNFDVTVSAQAGDTTPPNVAITSPTSGATVKGSVTIAVSAFDSSGISKVDLYVNNIYKKSSTSQPYSFSINTKSMKSGTYAITVVAFDKYGNTANSSIILIVANGNK